MPTIGAGDKKDLSQATTGSRSFFFYFTFYILTKAGFSIYFEPIAGPQLIIWGRLTGKIGGRQQYKIEILSFTNLFLLLHVHFFGLYSEKDVVGGYQGDWKSYRWVN